MQQRIKLCIQRDLTEHDVVMRIMRKENYLIGATPVRRTRIPAAASRVTPQV